MLHLLGFSLPLCVDCYSHRSTPVSLHSAYSTIPDLSYLLIYELMKVVFSLGKVGIKYKSSRHEVLQIHVAIETSFCLHCSYNRVDWTGTEG